MSYSPSVGVPKWRSTTLIELFLFTAILFSVALLPYLLNRAGNPEIGPTETGTETTGPETASPEMTTAGPEIGELRLSSSAASAGSSKAWTITEMSGRVNIVRSGAAPVALTMGDELGPGDMIETAADSGAILVRNGESIVVAPNSRMGLPAANDSGFATLILQQLGTLLLKVEKRPQRHFEVKTPYLVAIVKGTTFSVNVDSHGASVHVLEGAVEVANKTGMVALVHPGRTAVVSSKPGSRLSIQDGPAGAPAQPGQSTKNETGAGSGAADAYWSPPQPSWTSRPPASNAAPSIS